MRFLGIIRHNAERLARLTEDLLTLSRVEQKRQKFEFEIHFANALIHDAYEMMQPIAEKSRIQLTISGLRGPRSGHGGHRSDRAKTQAGRRNQTGRSPAPASPRARAFGARGGKAPDRARIARRSWSVADVSPGRSAYSGRLPEHSGC